MQTLKKIVFKWAPFILCILFFIDWRILNLYEISTAAPEPPRWFFNYAIFRFQIGTPWFFFNWFWILLFVLIWTIYKRIKKQYSTLKMVAALIINFVAMWFLVYYLGTF